MTIFYYSIILVNYQYSAPEKKSLVHLNLSLGGGGIAASPSPLCSAELGSNPVSFTRKKLR
jgi:hypothetical protein